MSEKHCYKLILDPEFERMCPPSIGRNHNDIEALIIEHGCPHPIQVWHKVILTDFVYYHICQDWGIEFEIEELSFTSRYDALYYAALHHVNNNTLSDVYHCILHMRKRALTIPKTQSMIGSRLREQLLNCSPHTLILPPFLALSSHSSHRLYR